MVPFDDLPEERKDYWRVVAAAVEEPWLGSLAELRAALTQAFVTPSPHGVARVINRYLYGWDKAMNPDPLDATEQRLADALTTLESLSVERWP
jgi:hypothetical protein